MSTEITIQVETQSHGNWLKIFIPPASGGQSVACIQNNHGDTIRNVTLSSGNNAIDISQVTDTDIQVKIETYGETLLRKIQIHNP